MLFLCLGLIAPATVSAAQRYIYVSHGAFTGSDTIRTLRINDNGSLTPLGSVASGGTVTEGLAITPDARHVYVAVFGANAVGGFNVNAATGSLSAALGSPFTAGFNPTPLGVAPDPDGGHLFAWNHGDAIATSTINANGSLSNVPTSPLTVPGAPLNPFGGSVAPDGDHLYVPNENNNPAAAPETVSAYTVAANGALTHLQTIASGNPAVQSNPFGSAITPDGNFLYVSNPEDGANGTVSGFRVNANGTLTTVDVSPGVAGNWRNAAPGNHPLNMGISPDGRHLYVATRATNTVNGYTIDQATGALTPLAGQPYATGGTNGKALALTPDGKRLYVSNEVTNNVSGFNRADNGTLTLIPGSPWNTNSTVPDLESIVITPNQAPAAAFATVPGVQTTFNASGSSDSDGGSVARYDWDFGDGATLANGGPTPQHRYAAPGTYNVTLTVTDDEGCSTERIFTGKATLCNGSSSARTTLAVAVPDCRGQAATLVGTPGDDALDGTGEVDVILGLDGNDTIRGLAGNDVLCGGNGKDRLSGGKGNDLLLGENGKDGLFGGKGRDRLIGGKGRDRLIGGKGKDKLKGGPGKDVQKQ